MGAGSCVLEAPGRESEAATGGGGGPGTFTGAPECGAGHSCAGSSRRGLGASFCSLCPSKENVCLLRLFVSCYVTGYEGEGSRASGAEGEGGKRPVMGACGMGAVGIAILALGRGPDGWLLVLWVMRWRCLNGGVGWDGLEWKGIARGWIAVGCADEMVCLRGWGTPGLCACDGKRGYRGLGCGSGCVSVEGVVSMRGPRCTVTPTGGVQAQVQA